MSFTPLCSRMDEHYSLALQDFFLKTHISSTDAVFSLFSYPLISYHCSLHAHHQYIMHVLLNALCFYTSKDSLQFLHV